MLLEEYGCRGRAFLKTIFRNCLAMFSYNEDIEHLFTRRMLHHCGASLPQLDG